MNIDPEKSLGWDMNVLDIDSFWSEDEWVVRIDYDR